VSFLSKQSVDDLEDVTPALVRAFVLAFSETHNPGGVHGAFRAVRAFCNWYATEAETWKNPILKVQAPKVPQELLEPVNLDDLSAMLDTCKTKSLVDLRDKAVLLFLLDSGCRRAEFCSLNMADLDMLTGAVTVQHGKGGRRRVTFIGAQTRKAMLAYLRVRRGMTSDAPLWIDERDQRLSFTALRAMLVRRAERAGVPAPTVHSFRRGFAINSLRAGVDLVSLQRLLGHVNLSVIQRYLSQTTEDLAAAHRQSSPVDRMMNRKGR